MKIHEVSILIVILSFITLGMVGFLGDMGTNYNQSTDMSVINNISTRLEVTEQDSTDLKNKIINLTSEEDEGGGNLFLPYKLIRVGLSIVKTFFRSFITLGAIIEEIGDALSAAGVPLAGEIITVLIVIITFTMVAIVLFALWKWRFSDE